MNQGPKRRKCFGYEMQKGGILELTEFIMPAIFFTDKKEIMRVHRKIMKDY